MHSDWCCIGLVNGTSTRRAPFLVYFAPTNTTLTATTWVQIPVAVTKMANFFLRVECWWAEAPSYIFKMRHGLKVVWITTRSNTAKMINLQSIGNSAFSTFKSEAVNINGFVFVLDDAITFSIQEPRPKPAAGYRTIRNIVLNSLFKGDVRVRPAHQITPRK